MRTFTGKNFDPLAGKPSEIDIRDIAHSLSMLCRFNGHTSRFYSVAEHSLRVSRILPPELQAWGLMHDAAEAYLGDMVRPLKCRMPEFEEAEDRLLEIIAARFGLPWPVPQAIWVADDILLATEFRDLMGGIPAGLKQKPLPETIDTLRSEAWSDEASPFDFERIFLLRAEELGIK